MARRSLSHPPPKNTQRASPRLPLKMDRKSVLIAPKDNITKGFWHSAHWLIWTPSCNGKEEIYSSILRIISVFTARLQLVAPWENGKFKRNRWYELSTTILCSWQTAKSASIYRCASSAATCIPDRATRGLDDHLYCQLPMLLSVTWYHCYCTVS